jgi:hypothetical protein
MQGTWEVNVTRLHGKAPLRYTQVSGRAPTVGEVLDWSTADGEAVKAKVRSFHHYPPRTSSNLGVWEIHADEIA